MGFLSNWCSLVVVSPVILFIALVGPVPPPRYNSGTQERHATGLSESEDTDEAVALQKVVSRISSNASDGEEEEAMRKARVRIIFNKDVIKELPQAPKSYPDALKGTYWLDQRGGYGHSDIPEDAAFDDLAVTWGGPEIKFDRQKRTLDIPTSGSTWTWFNTAHAYSTMALGQRFKFGYTFYFNRDYSYADIVPYLVTALGKIEVPKAVAKFTMEKMPKPKPGQCPPKKGATRMERTACAACKRTSTFFGGTNPLFNKLLGPAATYYIFQIGDKHHRRTPYFDDYLKFADTTSEPDPKAFYEKFGVKLPKKGRRKDVSLVFAPSLAT